jgi:hypothetical protein
VRAASAILLILGACAGTRPADAEISAAPADGGVRVRFRRLGGADPDRPPELTADGGALDEVTVSPDLKAVSALWREPRGSLTCRFPYDGVSVFEAGGPVDPATVEYVLLEAEGVRVTAALPRGCLLLPALPLRLQIGDAAPMATTVGLPRDRRGVLREGDHPLALETGGRRIELLLSIDADGTPAAVDGYVEANGRDIGGPEER